MSDSIEQLLEDISNLSDGAGACGEEVAAHEFARIKNRLEVLIGEPFMHADSHYFAVSHKAFIECKGLKPLLTIPLYKLDGVK